MTDLSYPSLDNLLVEFIVGSELEDIRLWISDPEGELYDFTDDWTLSAALSRGGTVYVASVAAVAAEGSGEAPDGTPNVTLSFTEGDFDALNPGAYTLLLSCNRDSDDLDLVIPITFVLSNPSTITWNYSGDPSQSSLDAVRFLIGDVDARDQQMNDQELLYLIGIHGDGMKCASVACLTLASRGIAGPVVWTATPTSTRRDIAAASRRA